MDDVWFVVTFRSPDDGSLATLKVRRIGDSDLGPSFVCLSDFVFQTGSRLHLPAEEAMQKRFENTRRLHLNVFAIQSIAEEGAANPGLDLEVDRSKLVVLPGPRGKE